MEEVTIDSAGSWKPVSVKIDLKHEDDGGKKTSSFFEVHVSVLS